MEGQLYILYSRNPWSAEPVTKESPNIDRQNIPRPWPGSRI